jgi:hypothetical protein
MLDSLSAVHDEKPFTRGHTPETGTRVDKRCINIIEEHTSVCNYYSLIDHLERRNSSRGQPIFQPILGKLLRDDLLEANVFSHFPSLPTSISHEEGDRGNAEDICGVQLSRRYLFGDDSSRFV